MGSRRQGNNAEQREHGKLWKIQCLPKPLALVFKLCDFMENSWTECTVVYISSWVFNGKARGKEFSSIKEIFKLDLSISIT